MTTHHLMLPIIDDTTPSCRDAWIVRGFHTRPSKVIVLVISIYHNYDLQAPLRYSVSPSVSLGYVFGLHDRTGQVQNPDGDGDGPKERPGDAIVMAVYISHLSHDKSYHPQVGCYRGLRPSCAGKSHTGLFSAGRLQHGFLSNRPGLL